MRVRLLRVIEWINLASVVTFIIPRGWQQRPGEPCSPRRANEVTHLIRHVISPSAAHNHVPRNVQVYGASGAFAFVSMKSAQTVIPFASRHWHRFRCIAVRVQLT